jgi:DnaK suppressor protein
VSTKKPAKAAPQKAAAKKPAAAAAKKTTSPAKKPAAAKPAPARKPAPAAAKKKPAPAKKPAAPKKSPATAPVTATKTASKTATKTTAAARPPASAAPKAPPPAAAKPAPAASAPRAPARAAKTPPAAAPAPLPPETSRFADRFAPARQTVRLPAVDTPRPPIKIDPKLANVWKTKAGRDLSEPELLSMPESEYMNDKQLDFFRARLTALKDDLLSNAGETTEHLREDTTIVPDPADRATIEEEHALELRTRDRERKLLKKISQSLARIEAGDYGFCDETGEPIGLGRLLARPTATLSLEAQQRRELKQKMFGD